MLQYIKKYIKGWLLGIIFFFIFLSFTFWGVGDIFSGSKNHIAKIGKNKISTEYFRSEFQRNVNFLSKNKKLDKLELESTAYETLKNIATRQLILNSAVSANIKISKDVLKKRVYENKDFIDNVKGEFDKNLYKRFVIRNFGSEELYLDTLEKQIIIELISDYYENKINYPENLTKKIYNQLEEKKEFDIASIDKSFLRSSQKSPKEESLSEHYNKNKDKYFFGERRSFTYIFQNLEKIKKKINLTEEEILEAYDLQKTDFATEEKRKVEQIVFSDEQIGNEIFKSINKDSNFKEIAKNNEKDASYINLGTVEKKQLFDEFADAVFELNNNNYTSLIKTDIGWHVLKVTEIIESKIKKIDEVKDKIKNNLSLDKAYDELDSLIIEVENNILDGNNLEEISNKLNLELNNFKLIEKNSFFNSDLPDEIKIDNFFNELYNQEMDSDLYIEEVENGFFIINVNKIDAKKQMTFDEAYNKIKENVQEEIVKEKIKTISKEFNENLKNNVEFMKISDALDMSSRTTKKINREDLIKQGLTIDIVNNVFKSEKNSIHENETDDKFFVIKVLSDSSTEFDQKKFDEIKKDINTVYGIDNFQQITKILEKKFPVSINKNLLNDYIDSLQY